MQAIRIMSVVAAMIGSSVLPIRWGWATEVTPAFPPHLPAIACAFELRVFSGESSPKSPIRQWYLWRQPERIERQDIHLGESEIWRRGRDGQIFYERVFHHDRRLIEFVPGDLRALQRYPDWHQLQHVIPPAWLRAHLQSTGTTDVLGRVARRYQGHVKDTELEVWSQLFSLLNSTIWRCRLGLIRYHRG